MRDWGWRQAGEDVRLQRNSIGLSPAYRIVKASACANITALLPDDGVLAKLAKFRQNPFVDRQVPRLRSRIGTRCRRRIPFERRERRLADPVLWIEVPEPSPA
jgi:hypothetical protein